MRIKRSQWIIGIPVLLAMTLWLLNDHELFNTATPWLTISKWATWLFFTIMAIVLASSIELTVDRKAGRYWLKKGIPGLMIRRRSGPLRDISYVIFQAHQIEDMDSKTVRLHYHLSLAMEDTTQDKQSGERKPDSLMVGLQRINSSIYLTEIAGGMDDGIMLAREIACFMGCGIKCYKGVLLSDENLFLEETAEQAEAALLSKGEG